MLLLPTNDIYSFENSAYTVFHSTTYQLSSANIFALHVFRSCNKNDKLTLAQSDLTAKLLQY